MSAKTVPSPWPGLALALGLGLATILGIASLARADLVSGAVPASAAQTANDFVCQTWRLVRSEPLAWIAPLDGNHARVAIELMRSLYRR